MPMLSSKETPKVGEEEEKDSSQLHERYWCPWWYEDINKKNSQNDFAANIVAIVKWIGSWRYKKRGKHC